MEATFTIVFFFIEILCQCQLPCVLY